MRAVKAWVVNPSRLPSSSMESTLHCARPGNDCQARVSGRVLANRFLYRFRNPQRGDLIVFDTPPEAVARCGAGGTFVKRLIVLPGERWRMESGVVYVNGKRLREPYLKPSRRGTDTRPPQRVPQDHYVMMGDNRTMSCDSRVWGAVARGNLIGKVFAVYWPPNRISLSVGAALLALGLLVPARSRRFRRW